MRTIAEHQSAPLPPDRAEAKRRAEARRDAACQQNPTTVHSDPDNSGQCIYCGAALDIIEGLDY